MWHSLCLSATHLRLLYSWGDKLCVDSRISTYKKVYNLKILIIKLINKQFLPCGNEKKQFLPYIYKTQLWAFYQTGRCARQRVCRKSFTYSVVLEDNECFAIYRNLVYGPNQQNHRLDNFLKSCLQLIGLLIAIKIC